MEKIKSFIFSKKGSLFLCALGVILILFSFIIYEPNKSNSPGDKKSDNNEFIDPIIVDDDTETITCSKAISNGIMKTVYFEYDNGIVALNYLNCVSKGTYINGYRHFGTVNGEYALRVGLTDTKDMEEASSNIINADREIDDPDIAIQTFTFEDDNYTSIEIQELIPDGPVNSKSSEAIKGTLVKSTQYILHKLSDDNILVIEINAGSTSCDQALIDFIAASIEEVDETDEDDGDDSEIDNATYYDENGNIIK